MSFIATLFAGHLNEMLRSHLYHQKALNIGRISSVMREMRECFFIWSDGFNKTASQILSYGFILKPKGRTKNS